MVQIILFETDFWNVYLNENQIYLGYLIIVLKRECGELSKLTKEEFLDFQENVVNVLEKKFKEKFGATMFNWTCLMNNEYKLENPKPQVHWHFRPRYKKGVIIEKMLFEDPNFAHHYDRKLKKIIDSDILNRIKERFFL